MRQADRDAAFSAYVAARRTHLRRFAYTLCGDWHQAEDLLQISLTKLYVAWPRVQREAAQDSYARRIILHANIDEHRRPWRREKAGLDGIDGGGPDRARPGGARRAAHRAGRAAPDAATMRGPAPLGRPLGRGDRARARHRARNRQGAHPPRRAAPPRAARRGHPGEHEELTMPDLHDRIDGLFADEPEHATDPTVHLRTGRRALRRRRITTGAARPRGGRRPRHHDLGGGRLRTTPRAATAFTATRSAEPDGRTRPTRGAPGRPRGVRRGVPRPGPATCCGGPGDAGGDGLRRRLARPAPRLPPLGGPRVLGDVRRGLRRRGAYAMRHADRAQRVLQPRLLLLVRAGAARRACGSPTAAYYAISLDGRRDPKVAAIEATFFDGTRVRSRTDEGYYLLGRRGRLPAGTAWAPNGMGGELRRNGVPDRDSRADGAPLRPGRRACWPTTGPSRT